MTTRTILLLAALSAVTFACSSTTEPPSTPTAEEKITEAPAETCSADAPIDALCAECPNGYRIANGETTCDCCTGANAAAGTPSTVCCDPSAKPEQESPEGVYCCADGSWQQSVGSGAEHTCKNSGGPGQVCSNGGSRKGASAEVCGGPPPNALCAPCPGGLEGYKQIDGEPTCECCEE